MSRFLALHATSEHCHFINRVCIHFLCAPEPETPKISLDQGKHRLPSLRQKKVRNREAYSVSLPISYLFACLFQDLSRTIYGDSEAKIWAPAPLGCALAENRVGTVDNGGWQHDIAT